MKQLKAARNIIKALGETHRLRILNLLRFSSLSVAEICEIVNSEQSNISRHLMKLRLTKLVIDKRDGQKVIYSLFPSKGDSLNKILDAVFEFAGNSDVLENDLEALRKLKKIKKLDKPS